MIPPLEVFSDKLIMLRCQPNDPEQFRMPKTDDQRLLFISQCRNELPAFIHWLNEWQIPEEFASARYGVASFLDPWIKNKLAAFSREGSLLECIDAEVFKHDEPALDERWIDANTWKGNSTELFNLLTRDASECRNLARGLCKSAIPLGKLLTSLAELQPDRVQVAPRQAHTNGYFLKRAVPAQD